jgi:probable HAF family extracellular repeat protein
MVVTRNSLPWCLVLGLTLGANGQDYVFTDLGTLGGDSTETHAINNSGQIVGYSVGSLSVATKAFSYENGIMTDLGTLGGGGSSATSINNRGQIVGYAQTEDNAAQRAFIYYKGVMSDLGVDAADSAAYGISDNGTVVGE